MWSSTTSKLLEESPGEVLVRVEHRMLVVHPIAVETYLERPGAKPRKSPKRGSIYSVFEELVSMPTLLDHPNLSLEVVLVDAGAEGVVPRHLVSKRVVGEHKGLINKISIRQRIKIYSSPRHN